MESTATMKWMLVVIIGLCWWCEVDAVTKCATEKECTELQQADWFDQKKHPARPLKGSDKTFFDQLGSKRSGGIRTMAATSGGVRKECRQLTDTERTTLHNGFKWLFNNKTSPTATLTLYQIFIDQHRSASAPDAHFGPCFPGFHREFLVRLTNALKLYDPSIELCYWDSSLDFPLPYAEQSCLWTAEYWGNGNGNVTTGFAANRPIYPLNECSGPGTILYRDVGGNSYLFTPAKISTISAYCYNFTKLMATPTTTKPYTGNYFESYHGSVHAFVFGHMNIISCSVNDPVFWLHHCFIDYLWEKCRQIQTTNKETDYPSDSGVPANHHYYDPMKPFQNKTCIDGLSNSYIPGIYTYADSPSTCTTHADCGGKALWCNAGKCTAVVGLNGRMLTGWANNGCYIPSCPTGKIPKNVGNYCKCG